MDCTLTAVPLRPVMRLMVRYLTARGMFQERKTAQIAIRNCSLGSSGSCVGGVVLCVGGVFYFTLCTPSYTTKLHTTMLLAL